MRWWIFDQSLHGTSLLNNGRHFCDVLTYSCMLVTLQAVSSGVDAHFLIFSDIANAIFQSIWWMMEHFHNQYIKVHENHPTLRRKSVLYSVICVCYG